MLTDNIDRVNGTVTFAGQSTVSLAAQYGTPLYLMDEGRLRANCRMYAQAFKKYFGENSLPLYASKAASFKQIYRIVEEEGLGTDTVSPGEICTAVKAGIDPKNIFFHGNCKPDADILYALQAGVGRFVVDSDEELLALDRLAGGMGRVQDIQLRVTPGIDPHTYEAVNTGMVDSKFGVAVETGQAMALIRQALGLKNVRLCGLHCHVGSQVFDEDVFERTIDIMVQFMAEVREQTGATMAELNLGGGYGVRYLESDKPVDIPARLAAVAAHLKERLAAYDLPMPAFMMEPGRSIVADAGMTLYTVGTVKRIPGYKNYVAIDGGMSDNPRYALYGAPYTVLHATKEGGAQTVFDLVGRCCESGDVIQPAVSLPDDTLRGDIIAVCTTGAYNYSMASNYNRIPRPPVVMLKDGGSYVAVRRETIDDLIALDE